MPTVHDKKDVQKTAIGLANDNKAKDHKRIRQSCFCLFRARKRAGMCHGRKRWHGETEGEQTARILLLDEITQNAAASITSLPSTGE